LKRLFSLNRLRINRVVPEKDKKKVCGKASIFIILSEVDLFLALITKQTQFRLVEEILSPAKGVSFAMSSVGF